jgi:Colicin V production protein
MISVFSVLIVLAVAYSFWREGVFTAFCMFINVFVAGLVAFNFFEPLAGFLESMFAGTFLDGYEDSISLVALAAATLGGLRAATNSLVNSEITYEPLVNQLGAGFFGLLTGYLVAGFLICTFQTLPWHENLMGSGTPENPSWKVDDSAPNAKMRSFFPPDRVWLALVHKASEVAFWQEDGDLFDPFGNFELRYARYRRFNDSREPMIYYQELKPKKGP